MQTYNLYVINRSVSATGDATLVRTSVGVDRVNVLIDSDEWSGFDLALVFENGPMVSVPVTASESEEDGYALEASCEVPPEVLEQEGRIQVTLHGTKQDGSHIITERAYPLSVVMEGDLL